MANKLPIALVHGDGIGPEIMRACLAIFDAVNLRDHVEFLPAEMGESVFAKGDSRGMTDEAIKTVESCGIVYKGPMGTPIGGGGKSINVSLRKMYSAYANVRYFRTLPGVETVYSKAGVPIDFYVIRENIEDTYGGIEHRLTNDVVECKRLISAPGCDQVHRAAFDLARKVGIKQVHCGHKANIMKMTDGLFLDRFRRMASEYPEVEAGDVIVDALCMNLVVRPQSYQMVVLPNLQGDIVSDLAAGLVGGLGFAPSANLGKHISIFEAVHGTAPDIAGKGIANPTALLLSGIMMLRHIGLLKQASAVENALLATLESGVRTGDFGDKSKPALNTADYAGAIISNIGKKPQNFPAAPEASADTVTFVRPEPPTGYQQMRTYEQLKSVHVGCDIYIDTTEPVEDIASKLQAICATTPFKLVMISSRGTQIWPTGSRFTECVDYYRVRFELRDINNAPSLGQGPTIALLDRIAEKFGVTDFQPLKHFDGKPGYSLAQGQ